MSDTEQKTTTEAPKTNWMLILKDMVILVCVMVTLGYLCNLAMKPFEAVSPTDSLVSLIRKGDVEKGEDSAFLTELDKGKKKNPDFVNSQDNTGRTPLMWAAYCNFNDPKRTLEKDLDRLYYVKKLLATPGVNVKTADQDGFTALHWAAWSGMRYSALLLMDAGLDVNAPEGNGYTPLMLAALRGNKDVVRMLLQLGANPAVVNKEGKTAQLLVADAEQAYNKRDNWKYKLIFSADREEFYRETLCLFSNPPAPVSLEQLMLEMQDAMDANALVSLIREGEVKNGSDPDFLKELAKRMKENPDFVNFLDNKSLTVLMRAVHFESDNPQSSLEKDVVRQYYVQKLLATSGMNPKVVNKDGFNALHWAAWSGMPHSALLLVEAGLDVNAPEGKGNTPLMLAAQRGNKDVVRILLQLGANPATENKEGKTAQLLAAEAEQAYNESESWISKLISWIIGSEDFYRETLRLFSNPPAAASVEQLKQEMQASLDAKASQKAAAEQAK